MNDNYTNEQIIDALNDASRAAAADTDGAPVPTTESNADQCTPSRALLDGDIVDGKYEILGLLDRGGMGEVYTAWDTVKEREVAIKVLPLQSVSNPLAQDRFRRTVESQRNTMQSEFVVATLDAGEHNGMSYLVMELIAGANLRKYVQAKPQKRLPWREAVAYCEQIALGLAHAHSSGLIHRDIKPANLMRELSGRVRILDWGLARRLPHESSEPLSALTPSVGMLGTPDFMAPEQALYPKEADGRSDLYSLGCTLYYLLTGRAPYGHETSDAAKLLAHVQGTLPRLDFERPDLPVKLVKLFTQLMTAKPKDRIQTAAEAAVAFKAVGEIPDEHIVTVTDARRRRSRALALGAGFAALLLGWAVHVLTNQGTIEIESFDEAIELSIVQASNGAEIGIVDTKQDTAVRVCERPGEYKIRVRRGTPELRITPDTFSLVRGKKVVVAVRRVAAEQRHDAPAEENHEIGNASAPPLDSVDIEQRKTIKWLLEVGGNAEIVVAGNKKRTIVDVEELPMTSFEVVGVTLEPNRRLTDGDFRKLRSFKHLRSLRVYDSSNMRSFSNSAFNALEEFSSLEVLVLRGQVAVEELVQLGKLRNLTVVELPGTSIGNATVRKLAALPELRSLRLSGERLSDSAIVSLADAGPPKLAHLDLWTPNITNRGMKELSSLRQLTRLDIGSTQINDEGMADVAKLTNLAELHVPTRVTDRGLERLTTLHELHTLHLTKPEAEGSGLAALATLRIGRLGISDAHLSAAGIAAIGKLQSITELAIERTSAPTEAWKALENLPKLESLSLHATESGIDGLHFIDMEKLSGLKALTLSAIKTSLSDADVENLAKLKSLRNLDLHGTSVSESVMTKLREAIPACTIVR